MSKWKKERPPEPEETPRNSDVPPPDDAPPERNPDPQPVDPLADPMTRGEAEVLPLDEPGATGNQAITEINNDLQHAIAEREDLKRAISKVTHESSEKDDKISALETQLAEANENWGEAANKHRASEHDANELRQVVLNNGACIDGLKAKLREALATLEHVRAACGDQSGQHMPGVGIVYNLDISEQVAVEIPKTIADIKTAIG